MASKSSSGRLLWSSAGVTLLTEGVAISSESICRSGGAPIVRAGDETAVIRVLRAQGEFSAKSSVQKESFQQAESCVFVEANPGLSGRDGVAKSARRLRENPFDLD
jgi:hypothetical protein